MMNELSTRAVSKQAVSKQAVSTLALDTQALSASDQQFLQQFEQLSLPSEQFNHLGHLRIAWLYLLIEQQTKNSVNNFDEFSAVNKVCVGIKAYAESLGAAMKFHFTLTKALVIVVANLMDELKVSLDKNVLDCDDWRLFTEKNPNLINDAIGVLKGYYSPELLNCDEAKLVWYEPDINRF